MRKWILTMLIAIFALPFFGSGVLAEETSVFEDGTYEIDYKVMHETEDKESAADKFMSKPATLKVESGNQYIQLELTGSSMIKSLTVPNGEVDLINEDKEGNTRLIGFEVEGDLSDSVMMEMRVVVPGVYEETHKARAFFDVSEVPVKEEGQITEDDSEENGEPPLIPENERENGNTSSADEDENEDLSEEEDTDTEAPNDDAIEDGVYQIFFVSDSSATNSQFDNPVTLIIENGKKYIQMSGSSGKFIKSLTINGEEVTWGVRDTDGQFVIQFEVTGDLSEELEFGMEINAGEGMEHIVPLSFDQRTQEPVENGQYTIYTESLSYPFEQPEEEADDPETEEERDDETKNSDDPMKPDKAFTIDFILKHATEDKVSAADAFFQKPAILLYKDGEKYLQITITGAQFIDSLKTSNGEVVLVRENDDGSIVVQFKVDDDISEMILLDMILTVPGVYDEQNHKARLYLDESTMEEIDASNHRLTAGAEVRTLGSVNDNTTSNGEDNNNNENEISGPEKPELGPGEGDNGSVETAAGGQETNPKTGDTTNIMLYVLLLIGSAIPLAIQLKRRFI